MSPRETEGDLVVLIHGIWMIGLEFLPLARRLRSGGFRTRVFHYASLRRTPKENAERLAQYVEGCNAERVHLVAHSLGGLVVLHLLARYPALPPGRVVLIGSPTAGSMLARRMARWKPFRRLLGRSVELGLLGDAPQWSSNRELGVIAGDLPFGVGLLLGGLPLPNDGTVTVDETRIPTSKDFRQIHASHLGLLFVAETARECASFLRTGRFEARS